VCVWCVCVCIIIYDNEGLIITYIQHTRDEREWLSLSSSLSLPLCVCVCVYIYTCIYTYIRMIHTYIHEYGHTHTHTHLLTYIHQYGYTHTHTHIFDTYIHIHVNLTCCLSLCSHDRLLSLHQLRRRDVLVCWSCALHRLRRRQVQGSGRRQHGVRY
jgi:hypothetical protein